MDFHDGISCQRFKLEGWGLVQCLLISFCFGSEILKKIGPPQPPPKKKDMDFLDGITFQRFELEGWDLVVFTNIILLWIRNFEENPTTPTPKKNQKTPKKRLMDFHDGITCQRFELEGWDLV